MEDRRCCFRWRRRDCCSTSRNIRIDEESEVKKIVIAGGGTGGHLFPALAVADEFGRRHPESYIEFIGSGYGLEQRLVPGAGYPLLALRLRGLKGRGPVAKFAAASAAGWAVCRCVLRMLASRPDLVVGVGGYASGPAVLAALLLKIKTMIMEQNHFPGATNRWLAPRVDAVCVPSEAARERLGGLGTVTGNPVRAEFFDIGDPPCGDALSLLVFGGSRGARSINTAMTAAADALSGIDPPPRIAHQTGSDEDPAIGESYAEYPQGSYEAVTFMEDMPARLAAADLVVCRAGASTLAELAAAGRPAILIPYPYAADDHQRHNAEFVRSSGAAVVIADDELDGGRLAKHIEELAADPERRRSMGRAARGLAKPNAAGEIVDIAERLITGGDRVP
jgi:UDP-N-acetylglucosamine--N-acetylmuramyl-(pentapeptide) pyrophosphoryl-undecaprenol N-acetylglucosamine transferase